MTLLKNTKHSKEKVTSTFLLPDINGTPTSKENTLTNRLLNKVESLPEIKSLKGSISSQKQRENPKIIYIHSNRSTNAVEIADSEHSASFNRENICHKADEQNNNSKLNKLKIPTNSFSGIVLRLEAPESNSSYRSNDIKTTKHSTTKVKRLSVESPRAREISTHSDRITPSKFRASKDAKLMFDVKKDAKSVMLNCTNVNINSLNSSTVNNNNSNSVISNSISNPNTNTQTIINIKRGMNSSIMPSNIINNVENISVLELFRHLIFGPKISDIIFSKYLAVTQKGISYSMNFLRGPSEAYLKSRQISLQNFSIGN